MLTKKTFCIVISLGLLFSHLAAQIPFEKLESDKPIELIFDIMRDSKGYLWLANSGLGLVRHNSYNARQYLHEPKDSSTISNNIVLCIFIDSKNNMWVGTRFGLNLYNYPNESFKRYYSHSEDATSLSSNIISSIFEDSDNNLWFITAGGIDKYNPKTDGFTRYGQLPEKDKYFEYTSMAQDKSGNYWVVSSRSGIFLFEPSTNSFEYFESPLDKQNEQLNIKRLYIDNYNNIWIASRGAGLSLFNPQTHEFTNYIPDGTNASINGSIVMDVMQLDSNQLLIAVDQGGINTYNYSTKKFSYQTNSTRMNYNLTSDGIYCFYKDSEDILWVGTSRGGVNCHNPKRFRFKTYRKNYNSQGSSLGLNIIGCFMENNQNEIWLGTDGGGISVFNPSDETFRNYTSKPKDHTTLSSNVIRSICKDSVNNIWIATFDKGINKYNKATNSFERNAIDLSDYKGTTIQNLLIDKKGRFWIGLPHGAVILLDNNLQELRKYFKDESRHTIRRPCIKEINNKGIFIIINEGVYLFNENTLDLQLIIDKKDCNDLCFDKKGNIYVGTQINGVYVYNENYELIKTIDEHKGLANNSVSYIENDSDNNIWAATMHGLSVFEPRKNNITNYYELDGLQGNTFFLLAGLKASDGRFFLGGTNGFNSFYPSKIKKNLKPSPIYIDKLYINDELIDPRQSPILDKEVHSTPKIELNWNQNSIELEFSAINFTYPLKNNYKYYLEGFNQKWITVPATMRSAKYTNLDPGDYTFYLSSTNNDHVQNPEVVKLKIRIKPPFWEQIWFYIILVVMAILSLILFIRNREQKLKRDRKILKHKVDERTALISQQKEQLNQQNHTLEEQKHSLETQKEELESQTEELLRHRNNLESIVAKRTDELKRALIKAENSDKLKSQFLANISHEIRTPMNAIMGFSNLLDEDEVSEDNRKYFSSIIKNNSEALLNQLQDILDISLIESDQMQISITAFKINPLISELAEYFKTQLLNSEVKLIENNQVKEFNYQLISDITRLRQILFNILNNAIKFTVEGNIELGVETNKDKLIFYVKDTGRGIKKENLDGIFNEFVKFESGDEELTRGVGLGLTLSKRLADLIDAKLEVESKFGVGSTFSLSLSASLLSRTEISDSTGELTKKHQWNDKSILLVEDEIANYYYLYEVLKATGIQLTKAFNGWEAVETYKEKGAFDLVLMDIKMPIMDGYEAIYAIRKINPEQVVIAQTAYVLPDDISKIEQHGFNNYLSKPIKRSHLLDLLGKYLD